MTPAAERQAGSARGSSLRFRDSAPGLREESSPRSSPQHVPGGSGSRQLKKACDLGAACFEKTALQWPIRRFSPNLLLLSRPNCKYEGSLSLCKRLIIKYFGKCGAPTSVESDLQSGSDVADLQFILENHLRTRCALQVPWRAVGRRGVRKMVTPPFASFQTSSAAGWYQTAITETSRGGVDLPAV